MAIAPSTSPGGVSMSRASRSMRGRMMSRTVRSPSRRASVATACSTASSTPSARPASSRCSMSSTETLGSSCLWAPSRNSTAEVAELSPQTSGLVMTANRCMKGATNRAIDSACRSASRLGTSSPSRSVKKEKIATNTVRAIGCAAPASPRGLFAAIRAARSLTIWSPPYAAASVPTSVMPICTVGRNLSGLDASSSAFLAASSPASAICRSRPRRLATIAISAPEKNPLARIRARTMRSSWSMAVRRQPAAWSRRVMARLSRWITSS